MLRLRRGGLSLASVFLGRRQLDQDLGVFERALQSSGIGQLPAVPFSKVMALVHAASLSYRIPPESRDEAVSAARIHHLAGCTFAAEFYPFTKAP